LLLAICLLTVGGLALGVSGVAARVSGLLGLEVVVIARADGIRSRDAETR
jgi:hypothetical protein